MRWLLKLCAIDHSKVTENDFQFETGRPIEFPYIRRTVKFPNFGKRFQQHIEPHGRYMVLHNKAIPVLPDQESGNVKFENPLVIRFNSGENNIAYDKQSWKARLSRAYGHKKGKDLSIAIRLSGYDGIVTVVDHNGQNYVSEIVDLRDVNPD